jgi:hypothetical protein
LEPSDLTPKRTSTGTAAPSDSHYVNIPSHTNNNNNNNNNQKHTKRGGNAGGVRPVSVGYQALPPQALTAPPPIVYEQSMDVTEAAATSSSSSSSVASPSYQSLPAHAGTAQSMSAAPPRATRARGDSVARPPTAPKPEKKKSLFKTIRTKGRLLFFVVSVVVFAHNILLFL